MNIKHLIVIGSAFLSTFAAQAGTCTWSGGTWSGGTWDVAPQSGDAIVINNATAGATFNVDVDSVNISSLTFKSGGKQCFVVGGTINISGNYAVTANHTMTISNNLALANSAPRLNAASGRSYYCGDITLTYATGDLRVYGAGGNTIYGKVTIPRDLRPGSGSNWKGGSHSFYGPVKCRFVLMSSSYDDSYYNYYSTSNSWTYFETAFYIRNNISAAGALPSTAILRAYGSDNYNNGTISLTGNQRIDRLSGTTKTFKVDGGSAAKTLTLQATASDASTVVLNGALSLVYAPTNSSYVQTISGGASSMSGSLTVSNGTFKVTNASTFKKVPAIYVKDGATFDIGDSVSTSALAALTTIELGENAKFVLSANNTTPFTDNAVTLNLKSTSEFTIPDGVTLYLEDVYIDGQRQPGGSIAGGTGPFKGTGNVFVREKEVPTEEATWDGGAGDDTALTTAGNWEGGETPQLQAGGLLAHFANGGSEATVSGTATFKGLAFDGTSPSFAIRGGETDLAKLRELGITVGANHNVTNAVATEIKADQCWTIGSGSTLALDAPVMMNATYAVTNLGPGKITLNAENGYKGPLYFGLAAATAPALEIGAATNAFGEASDEKVTLWMRNVANGLVLHDTVIERPLEVKNVSNGSTGVFFADGTNCFTKGVKFAAAGSSAGTGNLRLNLNGGRMAFEKGVGAGWPCAFYPTAGELVLHPTTGYATIHTMILSENARLVFEKDTDNPVQMVFTTFKMTGASTVTFKAADAATLGSGGGGYVGLYLSHASAKLDLNGFNQVFGPTYEMPNGVVTSATPAVWTTGTTAARTINSGVAFTGCAGFKLTQGTVTFTKAQASTNATVAVSDGTLAFAQDATWLGATNVVVSGTGKLVVNSRNTFRNAVVNITDTGKVEIPDGVTMRCAKLVVEGTEVTSGTYGSDESTGDKRFASHFTGKGVLTVGKLGLIISVR